MKKLLIPTTLLAAALTLAGCTDGLMGKLSAYNGSATIECYSAEKLIYTGKSTGKIASEANSDGYFFIDRSNGKLTEVSGNCVIIYASY